MSDSPDYQALLQQGLDLPDDKKLYFNGFTVSLTPPDFVIVLQHNNQPVALLNSSHIIGKTLGKKILGLFENFDKNVYFVPILDEIVSKINAPESHDEIENKTE